MASAKLNIRKNPSGSAKILLVFNYGRKKRVRYTTQYTLKNFKNWDKSKNRIKIIKEEPLAEAINDELSNFLNHAEKLVRTYDSDDSNINSDIITKDLNSFFVSNKTSKKLKKKNKNQDFLKYFEWFLDFYSVNPRPKTNKPYNSGTLRTLRNTKELVEKFQKNRKRLQFDDIDLTFHANILKYMTTNNYSVNYKGTVIKNIKTVMNDSFERDLHSSRDFQKSTFSKPTEDVENIYLTENEIEKIRTLDLSQLLDAPLGEFFTKDEVKPTLDYLDRCRDFFCIGCYTGLRVSDLLLLKKKNIIEIKSNGIIKKAIGVQTQKTAKRVEIPIKTNLQKILDKYDNDFPQKVVDSKINLYIKKIGKAAKINEASETKETVNGIAKKIWKPKYERISSHTARRSFCTNAYHNGMHPIEIMTISGHKTEKAFLAYIKATPRDRFDKIANHAFFE